LASPGANTGAQEWWIPEYELGGRPRCLNVLSSVLIAINKRIATLNGVQLPQDRLGLRVEAVSNTPLDMSNPYGRTREFRCKPIDFDAVQDFRAYQRCVRGQSECLALIVHLQFQVLHGLQCEIKEIAGLPAPRSRGLPGARRGS
jgi:hypothetical protein